MGVLASIHTTNLPTHSPPQIPLAPSVPISPPEPSYLTDILDLYLGYLGRILTISWLYILGLSHFLNTFNTVPQQVDPSACTTIPKGCCEVKSIRAFTPLPPLLYNYSSSPTQPLHWSDFNTRVIFPPFNSNSTLHSNSNIFASTQTF